MTKPATPPTAEEIAAARALVAQADEAECAAAAAALDDAMKPLREIVGTTGFDTILAAASQAFESFAGQPIGDHLNAMIIGMTNLRSAVENVA